MKNCTYYSLVGHIVGEILLHDVRISDKNLDDGFCESFHVPLPNFWIWTFQFRYHVETLRQLGEDINNGYTEKSVFAALLELQ